MPTEHGKRLTKNHIDLIRGVAGPGVREVEVSAAEVNAMLDEIEHWRAEHLMLENPEARTKTTLSADTALIEYRAMLADHTIDMPDAEEGPVWTYPLALGYFLGLGLDLPTARHLALRV